MKRSFFRLTVGIAGLLLALHASWAPAFRDETPPIADDSNKTTKTNLNEGDISRFTDAITQIKQYYVQPISDKKLLEDAIRGMLAGLDPHSEYLDPETYKSLLVTTSGEFGGLGIEVTSEYGVLKVISPIDDTPAAKAGIKPGDYIVAINSKLVDEMTMNEAVNLMRGKAGSYVTLTVVRKDTKTPLSFHLERAVIHVSSVKSKLINGHYGYIRLSEFGAPTSKLMTQAIDALKKQAGGHLSGLVLDLRNNPGGLLESAVNVANQFLDPKKVGKRFDDKIVYTEGRLHDMQYTASITAKGASGDIINGAPMVALVNEGSASASEIVAGALQDYRRAIIVGVTSFGKGSVQTVLPLDDTHAIKLTTALYHTPSGRLIQNLGITPDINVPKLQISSEATQTAMLTPIRELELKGHLAGTANAPDTKAMAAAAHDAQLAMAHDDFQLYQAIDILKTMNVVANNTLVNK